jgi:hypothetical protein
LKGNLPRSHFTRSAKTNVLNIHAYSYAEQYMEHAVRSGLALMHSCMDACMHAGDDGTYTEPQRGPQPAFVWLHQASLIVMGIAAALTLCAGFSWYWLVRTTRALHKQEEEAASQEAVVEREHKNAVVPVI